jgi:hypothetical protein
MFPEGFFFDATLLVAVATAVEAVVILSLGILLRVLGSRATRSA